MCARTNTETGQAQRILSDGQGSGQKGQKSGCLQAGASTKGSKVGLPGRGQAGVRRRTPLQDPAISKQRPRDHLV
jgi:hypothetical protein